MRQRRTGGVVACAIIVQSMFPCSCAPARVPCAPGSPLAAACFCSGMHVHVPCCLSAAAAMRAGALWYGNGSHMHGVAASYPGLCYYWHVFKSSGWVGPVHTHVYMAQGSACSLCTLCQLNVAKLEVRGSYLRGLPCMRGCFWRKSADASLNVLHQAVTVSVLYGPSVRTCKVLNPHAHRMEHDEV